MTSNINCEFIFKLANYTSVNNTTAGIMIMSGGGNTLAFACSSNLLWWYRNGAHLVGAGYKGGPPAGTAWLIKLDIELNTSNTGWTYLYSQYSTDGGTTWSNLITNAANPSQILTSSLPTAFTAGLYCDGTVVTATTGPHIANLIVQDPAPAPPTCQVSKAYVTTGGQSVAFFFETISGNTAVTPTAMNFAPSFFLNGVSIGGGVNAWVTGKHSCAIVQLQPGTQINPGDTVTVSTPASWMSCGLTNAANEVANLAITNYSGMSCFGTNTLVKAFKPGLNFSALGTTDGTQYNIPLNWRYRLQPAEAGSTNTVDGYPTVMLHPTEKLSFLSLGTGNSIDATQTPGVPGMWAIGFDDNYVAKGGSPTTLAIVSQNIAKATVTSVPQVSNSGIGGLGQYYMFNVQPTSGSTSADLPIALQWTNSARTPYISNLWILGPGDFTYTLGTPLTFNRPTTGNAPYALGGQFLERLANGAGSMRFCDSWLTYASMSNESEPWELRNLTDFSWNNALRHSYVIRYTAARGAQLSEFALRIFRVDRIAIQSDPELKRRFGRDIVRHKRWERCLRHSDCRVVIDDGEWREMSNCLCILDIWVIYMYC